MAKIRHSLDPLLFLTFGFKHVGSCVPLSGLHGEVQSGCEIRRQEGSLPQMRCGRGSSRGRGGVADVDQHPSGTIHVGRQHRATVGNDAIAPQGRTAEGSPARRKFVSIASWRRSTGRVPGGRRTTSQWRHEGSSRAGPSCPPGRSASRAGFECARGRTAARREFVER